MPHGPGPGANGSAVAAELLKTAPHDFMTGSDNGITTQFDR
jgi:hypothetical protein